MSLLLARTGHAEVSWRCPLLDDSGQHLLAANISGFDPQRTLTVTCLRRGGPKNTPLCFRRHCINDVGFDEFDTAFAKGRQIYFSNSRCGFVVHLFERPAISRSTHYRPPVLRRLKGLLTVLCDDVSIFDSALCQKLANGLRCD